MSRRPNREYRPIVDMFTIMKYCALFVVFALVIFGVNKIVLTAIGMSPTQQVGNGMLTLYEVHNTGAAFNLFAGHSEMIITASFLAVAAMAFIIIMFSSRITHTAVSAMALLSAGITMNMIDRINHGYVIDYIHCNFMPSFPVFNTADIMIVFGALGLILALFSRD